MLDRDGDVAATLAELLALDGHEATVAAPRAGVPAELAAAGYDVVIASIERARPGPLGADHLAHELLSPASGLRLLLTSTDEGLAREVAAASRAPIVCKPFRLNDLRRAMEEVLGRTGAGRHPTA